MKINTCSNCVLDSSALFIFLDKNGVCNYCHDYKERERQTLDRTNNPEKLQNIFSAIKQEKGEYDCIVGVSGGLDSSYLLYQAKKWGLNPLAVHCDMGWNTEKAVFNIESLVQKLNIELYTYVVNWEEFKDVQVAYLRSGVIDLEIPTDHAFVGALYKVAEKFNIRYILTGHNFVTEGIMPPAWIHNKGDTANLLDIHRKHGKLKELKSFPVMTLLKKFWYYNVKRIENIHPLNYIDYTKKEALTILQDEVGWQSHPSKHGESVFTRFYQGYILPQRFGVDKRKVHLSNLICSGQISRKDALKKLKEPIYESEMLEADKEFVLKKFGISPVEFQNLMSMPIHSHFDYNSEIPLKNYYARIRKKLKNISKVFRISNHW